MKTQFPQNAILTLTYIQTQIVRNGRIEVHHIIRHKDIAGTDVNALEAASQIVSVANVRSGVTHQWL